MSEAIELKICLLGDSGVGKSSLASRFVHNTFSATNESTIGASFMTKTFQWKDRVFKLNIWDTAGQEMYRALAPMYYRQAAVCIVVYDVTQQDTFRAVLSWVKELRLHVTDKTVIAIAANKSDLSDARRVPPTDGQSLAESVDAVFVETSAKTGQNVSQLFCAIAARVPERTTASSPSSPLSLSSSEARERTKCC